MLLFLICQFTFVWEQSRIPQIEENGGTWKNLTIVLASCFIDWTQKSEPASKQALIFLFLTDFYIYRESTLCVQHPTLLWTRMVG